MTQQQKLTEQLNMIRRMHEERLHWYEKMNDQDSDPLMLGSTAQLISTGNAQIGDLETAITDAGGTITPTSGLLSGPTGFEADEKAVSIEKRMINAYEEIIADTIEPNLPPNIISLLKGQQEQLRQQIQ